MKKAFYKDKLLLSFSVLAAIAVAVLNADVYKCSFTYDGSKREFVTFETAFNGYCYYLSFTFFALFLFLAYEYFYKSKKDKCEEVFSCIKDARMRIFFSQFAVLECVNVLLCVLIYFSFIAWSIVGYDFGGTVLLLCLKIVLFNFFLPITVAILFGKLVSYCVKRSSAYMLLVIIFGAFVGSVFTVVDFLFRNFGINLYDIWSFFSIFQLDLGYHSDFVIFYDLLPYRLFADFFWIIAAITVILLKERIPIKKTVISVSAICLAATVALTLYPQQKHIDEKGEMYKTISDEALCYLDGKMPEKQEKASFEVTAYNLDIKIRLNMFVRASVEVSNPELSEYIFTLFHGFTLKNVTDSKGNKLDFEQNGDYITVKRSSEPLKNIVMEYKGGSSEYYSNLQGVNIPNTLAFYPLAGFVKLRKDQSLNMLELEKPTEFKVNFDYNKKVFSNITEIGYNQFDGKTTAPVFLAGFVESVEYKGVKIVYPYYAPDVENDLVYTKEQIDNGKIGEDTRYIFCGAGKQKVGDTIIVQRLNADYKRLVSPNTSKDITGTLIATFKVPNLAQKLLQSDSTWPTDEVDRITVKECIDKVGIDEFIKQGELYIADETDTRTIYEFLEDLCDDDEKAVPTF